MSNDEKDKLGELMHNSRIARELEWVRKHEEELLAKLRARKSGAEANANCPECAQQLVEDAEHGTGGLVCPARHGAWLSWDTIVKMLDRLAHPKPE